MNVLHRTSVSAGEGMDFVISDGSLDRHGTRINPKGWDLRNFKKNPIALFGHDSRFPIGTWENIRTEGDKLVATPREREIMSLVARGLNNREIAELLAISVLTVRTHRQNLMEKFSLRNAAEITAYAVQRGYYVPA